MKFSKTFRRIIGIGAVYGVVYAAYKFGEASGKADERIRQKYDEVDDFDLDDNEEEDYSVSEEDLYSNKQTGESGRIFGPIEIINISGVTIGQLRGLLLYLTTLKNFCRKNVREYLGIDEDIIIDRVIALFEANGYICKRDKYKYHTVTNIEDCAKIIGW